MRFWSHVLCDLMVYWEERISRGVYLSKAINVKQRYWAASCQKTKACKILSPPLFRHQGTTHPTAVKTVTPVATSFAQSSNSWCYSTQPLPCLRLFFQVIKIHFVQRLLNRESPRTLDSYTYDFNRTVLQREERRKFARQLIYIWNFLRKRE